MNQEKKFVETIKILRKSKGFTQEKLAEKANIDEKYLGNIERGENSPTLRKVFGLFEALEVDMEAFGKLMKNQENK